MSKCGSDLLVKIFVPVVKTGATPATTARGNREWSDVAAMDKHDDHISAIVALDNGRRVVMLLQMVRTGSSFPVLVMSRLPDNSAAHNNGVGDLLAVIYAQRLQAVTTSRVSGRDRDQERGMGALKDPCFDSTSLTSR